MNLKSATARVRIVKVLVSFVVLLCIRRMAVSYGELGIPQSYVQVPTKSSLITNLPVQK